MNDLVKGAHITKLKQSMESAINSKEMQQVEFPLEHYFTPTQYARRIFVPADHTVITAVHKSEHVTIALKGHCVVVDELGDRHDVIAPAVFITKPGTQRAVYAVTDTEWLTVHTYTDEDKSLDAIGKVLVCDNMDQYENALLEASLCHG